ncbi:hypothetical protein C2869_11420 [Saccharobesus litoralis]|uniref:Uncharacterized protein n=1 Tax=Saccharobesus litoralis TaxID=2172099 RepID=A0A2S0VS26_9ALTE|nr:DUF6776 family protein [Saccharobesus litoralis]AWB67009.1 hypothetical protein C2869_11420 [Saccharobesus litoralis]
MENKPNKLVYHNLDIIWHNLKHFYTGLYGVLLLIAIGLLGYWIASKHYSDLEAEKTHYVDLIAQREAELAAAKQELNYVRVELEVEKLAAQTVQKDLNKLKQENTQLKKDISFYQNVMAPENSAEGVILEHFIIEPTLVSNRFRYKVTLVQTRKQKRFAKGYIGILLKGQKAQVKHELNISELGIFDEGALKFSFRYFQILEGEFTLPDDFTPERVFLNITLPKSRWQQAGKLNADFAWTPGIEHVE